MASSSTALLCVSVDDLLPAFSQLTCYSVPPLSPPRCSEQLVSEMLKRETHHPGRSQVAVNIRLWSIELYHWLYPVRLRWQLPCSRLLDPCSTLIEHIGSHSTLFDPIVSCWPLMPTAKILLHTFSAGAGQC